MNTTQAPSVGGNTSATWETYFFGVVVCVVFVCLVLSIAPVFSILCSTAVLLYLVGIVDDAELFSGLVNNGVLAIAMLFVIVHPVVDLPVMKVLIEKMLGSLKSTSNLSSSPLARGANALDPDVLALGNWARFKVCLLSMITSPFLENTPQTAMFTPLIADHCRRIGLAPSQILMPMCFAILLGNYFPLGYSTNLIVSGLMEKHGLGEMPLIELAKVNLPLLLPILAYLVFAPRYLLPLRRGGVTFYSRFKITHNSSLVGVKVSDAFQSFFANRTESAENVHLLRQNHSASTVVEKKLSWEKIGEPFCRLLTLQPSDEIIIGGLLATIGQPQEVSDSSTPTELATCHRYVSPTLGVVEESVEETHQRSSADIDEEREHNVAEAAATNMPTADARLVASLQRGEIEGRLHEILIASVDHSYMQANDDEVVHQTRARSDTIVPMSPRSAQRRAKQHQSHQSLVIDFCKEFGTIMMSMKINFEGSDLLKDEIAYTKTQNIAASPHLIALPEESFADSNKALSPTSSTHHREDEEHLLSTTKRPMTWCEWHISRGGRMFRTTVPMWFPVGTIESPDDDVQPPGSPTTKHSDVVDPHKLGPHFAVVDDTKKALRKIWKLPWWYEYLSLVNFLGVVVASFFDVKLSISCFVACCACVVFRLISTKDLVRALPIEIYLLVAFSFPLGSGMQQSGLAGVIGRAMVEANVTGIWLLYLVGLITLLFTNMITANGSVQVIFPLVVKVYEVQNLHPLPGIMMLASTLAVALCTPFAIPSNAVILVPGGYHTMDYMKFGAPLTLMVLILLGMVVATVYDSW